MATTPATPRRPDSLIAQVATEAGLHLDGEQEGAWIDVIHKMDEVYSDLLRYEADLEAKNAALEEAQTFISSVLQSVSDVLIVCDISGRIQQANAAMSRLLGRDETTLLGQNLRALVDGVDAYHIDRLLDAPALTAVANCELRFVTPAGASDLFAVNSSPRYDHDGRRVGSVLTGRPIGELRRAYEALHAAHGELQRAQRQLVEQEKMASLGRLVAGVAHELNNPISFVYGNIHALKRYRERMVRYCAALHDAALPQEIMQLRGELKIDALLSDLGPLIDGTLEGAVRVSDIVKNLRRLSFSRSSEIQTIDIDRVIRTAVKWASRAKSIKTEVVLAIEPGLEVRGNEGQIHQVIVNLVDNALDAMQDGDAPRLDIRALRRESDVIIEIADNGPGIAEDVADKIFEPFFTTKEVGEGTGLGLWISYGIAREHGGGLRVLPHADGGGATFVFSLPAI